MNDVQHWGAGQQLGFPFLWSQFHSILGAIAIFIIGYIAALLISGGVKKLLEKGQINQKYSKSTARGTDIERILSRVIFWFIFIIAIVAGLNALDLNGVSAPFAVMIGNVLGFLPKLLAAAGVAFVGWLVATLVRSLLTNALGRTQLDEKLSSNVGVSSVSSHIAEIAYWLILLIFLTMVLSILGLNGLLAPIQAMVTKAVSYIPNLFMAAVIIFAGYIVAKIVRGIVEGLVNGFGLQAQAEKIGVFKQANLPKLLGSFVFTIIIITALIVAFDTLGVQAISQPATAMLNQIMAAIPNILGAAIILILAYVVARFVAQLITELLAGTGVDELPAKLGVERFLGEQKLSALAGSLIIFFTMLFATIEAANRLGFHQISDLIGMFIHFGANILLGAVILVIGFWLANMVGNVVQRGEHNSARWLGTLVRVLVMGLVLAMGLHAMGIADAIVNLAFGLTLGGVAVAFALAFGLGGRAPAERVLNKLLDKAEKEGHQPNLKAAFDNAQSQPANVNVEVAHTAPSNVTITRTDSVQPSTVVNAANSSSTAAAPQVQILSAVSDISLNPQTDAEATLSGSVNTQSTTAEVALKPKDWEAQAADSSAKIDLPNQVTDISLNPQTDADATFNPEQPKP